MTATLEDIQAIEIENWGTLATAPSSTKLKIGQSPALLNVWVDEKPGSVITANGLVKVGQIPSNLPVPFCCDFFRTAAGTQTFVVSDNATVWTTVDFQNFTSIITGLSSSFQLRGAVIRDKLWLTNGSDSVRTFDGTTVTVLDGTAGTPNVPKGKFIGYHDERVWVYHTSSARSQASFTALTDNTGAIIAPDSANAWPTSNTLQISEGDADFGTAMLLYRGTLLFFKQYSIYRLVGYDEYTYSRVKTRASTGTRFAESIQVLDNLVHLIGIDGIYTFDGEDSDRISDLIDPATASQTAFGFNQLQQPNTNNRFFEVTDTADWNAGTVPVNVTIADSLTLKAADTTTADFNSGTLTRVTANDIADELVLTTTTTSNSHRNVALDVTGSLQALTNTGVVGTASYMTDANTTNACGFSGSPSISTGSFNLSLVTSLNLTTFILRGVFSGNATMVIKHGGVAMTPTSINNGASIIGNNLNFPPVAIPTDYTIVYPAFTTTDLQLVLTAINSNTSFTLTEIEVYAAAYQATGKFVSKSLDLGEAPHSLGNFNATTTVPSFTTLTFFTQSSADNSSWDAEVTCTNGGAIGSTVRRYLRWGANFTSNGDETPVITDAWLPTQYKSPVHDTGGSIFAWGPIESDRNINGQTINYYYRTGTTSPNCLAATWNLIVPSGVISDSVSNSFVQFKFEIYGGTATAIPVVTNVTLNWTIGSATQVSTLQNVASAYWRNRYWLAAAGPGASSNDTILVRGKKTYGSPWQLKDWAILSFTRFQDNFYGGSSVDGSIYQLDTGYSLAGVAIDSYFQTGDFVKGGFQISLSEIMIEVERVGPYSLYVGVSIDEGITFTEKTVDLTVGGASTYFKKLNFNIAGDRMRFRVRTDAVDQPFQVHSFIAYYTLSRLRGSIN